MQKRSEMGGPALAKRSEKRWTPAGLWKLFATALPSWRDAPPPMQRKRERDRDPEWVQGERIHRAQAKRARRAERDLRNAHRMIWPKAVVTVTPWSVRTVAGNPKSVWLRLEDGRVLRGDEVKAEERTAMRAARDSVLKGGAR